MNIKVFRRAILTGILLVIIFLLPLIARSVYESWISLENAQILEAEGKLKPAIDAYAQALRWRGIFNIYATKAQTRLIEFSQRLGGSDRIYALSELRQALFASRSFYFHTNQDLELIDEITSQLEQAGDRIKNPITEPQVKINFYFQILAQLGFWAWVAATILLICFGFSKEGKIISAKFCCFALIASVAFVVWILGLFLA